MEKKLKSVFNIYIFATDQWENGISNELDRLIALAEKQKKDIEPCPFCGADGKPLKISDILADGFHERWLIECECNDCMGRGPVMYSERGAITAWNKRKLKDYMNEKEKR